MEPLMAAGAEPTDMLRVGRSSGYRLTAAMQRESIKIGRSQRASLASIRHVAAQRAAVDGLTRGHSHPASRPHRGRRRRRSMVLAALAVVDDCGHRRVSDVGLDAARAASPGSRAPQDRAGTDLREARCAKGR
jgi:hypothetical protein